MAGFDPDINVDEAKIGIGKIGFSHKPNYLSLTAYSEDNADSLKSETM